MSKAAEEPLSEIAARIFIVRGRRVMLDLASLCGAPTKVPN
jgi:hypothetical protein